MLLSTMNLIYRFVRIFLPLVMSLSSQVATEKADFDFYVFSMSYQPEFCYAHRPDHYAGCQQPMNYWKTHLTIHGLWPERRDGSWPASCSTEPLDKRVVDKLAKDLDYYWPNIKDLPDDPDYSDFWSHEWGKHGTCSGLSQLDYFQTALEHQIATPPLVQQAYGKTISKTDLLEAYNNKVVPVCSHRRYLQEVRACYAMDVDGRPTARVECPAPVQKEGNCGDEITLSKFPAMQAQRPTQAGDSSLRKEGARVS